MFEKAVFRRSDKEVDFHLNVGQLAEALLYYGEIDLLLDQTNLGQLLSLIGFDATLRLVKLPFVRSTLVTDDLATITRTEGFESHGFTHISLAGKKGKMTKEERVREIFARKLGNDWTTKKQADFLSQYLSEASFGGGLAGSSTNVGARSDVLDQEFAREAARIILNEKIPGIKLPTTFSFRAVEFNDLFVLDTDLDFGLLALEYEKFWPKTHSSLTPAAILTEILQARASLGLSAKFDADLFTTSISSKVMSLRMEKWSRSLSDFGAETAGFSEWALQGRSISDALSEGSRSFHEFLDLVEKADDFKKWIVGRGSDRNLAKQYFAEVGASGWLDKLPAKSFRYMAFTGLSTAVGLVASPGLGAAAGAALSAVDSFVLDRLLKGWKPSHFVDGKLKPFLGK